jgi:uncharacterized protein YbjT (DUF2867 family)
MIKAIIFGATGMVGEGVLRVALRDPRVASVLVIGRRPCEVVHPKLRELIHTDFFDYAALEDHLSGWNACFFCLGVTSVGKREEEYTRLTYHLTMAAARVLARHNPDMTFCYVSGTGTDATEKGRTMWARVKGRTENHLRALPFRAAVAFRPGFIKPIPGQHHAYRVAKVLGLAYPLWRVLFPRFVCTLEDLGLAMIRTADAGSPKPVLENPDIATLAQTQV